MVEQAPGQHDHSDAHLHLLSLIEQHPDYSQRRLAEAMGVSLGKTHYLLKALFDKGLVKAGNFRRSDSKLRFFYLLTPAGMTHRIQLTRQFLQRKEREFELLRSQISMLRASLDEEPVSSAPDSRT